MKKKLFIICTVLSFMTPGLFAREEFATSIIDAEPDSPNPMFIKEFTLDFLVAPDLKGTPNATLAGEYFDTDHYEFHESFSGKFPSSKCRISARGVNSGEGYTWGKAYDPNYSGMVWCAGTNLSNSGPDLQAGIDNYPDDMSAWMIVGPFDLCNFRNSITVYADCRGRIDFPDDHLLIGVYESNTLHSGVFQVSSDNYRVKKFSTIIQNRPDFQKKQFWVCFIFNSNSHTNNSGVWIHSIRVSIDYYKLHIANFEASPLAGKAPLDVQFFNRCDAPLPTHFIWDLGDSVTDILRESPGAWTNPKHIYTQSGTYDVSLKAWNQWYGDFLQIPNMIYVDSLLDYCSLSLVESGATYTNEGWENLVDHDIYGTGAKVAAVPNDAHATFITADSSEKRVSKIRFLSDTVEKHAFSTNFAKDIRISLSRTGEFAGEEIVLNHTCTELNGEWSEIEVQVNHEPVLAKFIRVEILSARSERAKYFELVEMQVMGTDLVLAKGKPDLADQSSIKPETFTLDQNYPNPFNPQTTIKFGLPEAATVQLAIYNIQGQMVKMLVSEQISAGIHARIWDGSDQSGQPVAGGVYIYKLQTAALSGPKQLVNKLLLLK